VQHLLLLLLLEASCPLIALLQPVHCCLAWEHQQVAATKGRGPREQPGHDFLHPVVLQLPVWVQGQYLHRL
jgi:hypothetical protein